MGKKQKLICTAQGNSRDFDPCLEVIWGKKKNQIHIVKEKEYYLYSYLNGVPRMTGLSIS